MQAGKPSGTAYRVALRRAAHQLFDSPVIFHDPLAPRILGIRSAADLPQSDVRAPSRPHSAGLRAFLVARSRFAEDTLANAVYQGASQYVLLGAGLDTFAYRNPHPGLRVFEVDHPDTQQWKLSLLQRSGIAVPASVVHTAVDFQRDSLAGRLASSGFDRTRPAVFAWLGVVPYLTLSAFNATVACLAACAPGSQLVFDYAMPRPSLSPREQIEFDSLAARVAAAGEPFQLFFTPAQIAEHLAIFGWCINDDLDRDAINGLYFSGHPLQCVSSAGHLVRCTLASNGCGSTR